MRQSCDTQSCDRRVLQAEKQELQQEVDTLRDHIDQLQVDCDRFLEEKSTDTARVTQLEAKLDAVQSRVYELEGELTDLRQKYWSEQEEWKQFQSDLQMAVVIANEIKVCSPRSRDAGLYAGWNYCQSHVLVDTWMLTVKLVYKLSNCA